MLYPKESKYRIIIIKWYYYKKQSQFSKNNKKQMTLTGDHKIQRRQQKAFKGHKSMTKININNNSSIILRYCHRITAFSTRAKKESNRSHTPKGPSGI
jgi:hypothetical protein